MALTQEKVHDFISRRSPGVVTLTKRVDTFDPDTHGTTVTNSTIIVVCSDVFPTRTSREASPSIRKQRSGTCYVAPIAVDGRTAVVVEPTDVLTIGGIAWRVSDVNRWDGSGVALVFEVQVEG